MSLPTWGQLVSKYCSRRFNVDSENPYYEDFSIRRYNYATSMDKDRFRFVFLKDVMKDKSNKTLCRSGRFIWCSNLRYEGRDDQGFRQVSFTVDKGKKRFKVSENNILCIPSKIYVNNNKFFRSKLKTFYPFSSVFSYRNTLSQMAKDAQCTLGEFQERVKQDSPFKPGALVAPRLGYFHPEIDRDDVMNQEFMKQEHPFGIVISKSHISDDYVAKEFYTVRFGKTTYDRVHPVQLEIINEV